MYQHSSASARAQHRPGLPMRWLCFSRFVLITGENWQDSTAARLVRSLDVAPTEPGG